MGSALSIPHTMYFISFMFIVSIAKVVKIQPRQQLEQFLGIFSYTIMSSGCPGPMSQYDC